MTEPGQPEARPTKPRLAKPRLTKTWKGEPIRAPRRAERVRFWGLSACRIALALVILARIGDRRTTVLVAMIGLGYCWTRAGIIQNESAAVATSRNMLDRLQSKLAGHEERRSEWRRWWRNGRGTAAIILAEGHSLRIVALICIAFLWRALQGP